MTRLSNRRRFLQVATAGAAASIAGCNGLQSSTDDGGDPDASEDGSGERIDPEDVSETALTALVQPDPDELRAIEAELVEQVEAGELDEMEAQQEMQARQMELVDELVDSFESTADATEEYGIEASMPDQGAFLVDGDANALVSQLNDGDVSALLPSQDYIDVQEAAAAQPDPEDLEDQIEEAN